MGLRDPTASRGVPSPSGASLLEIGLFGRMGLLAQCSYAKSASTKKRTRTAAANADRPQVRKSRQKQIDWLCGEKINDGCGRASRTGTARPECAALPTPAPDGAAGESTASGDAASTFRWLERNSLPLPSRFQADGSPSDPGHFRPALHALCVTNRRKRLNNFENTSRWQILQGAASR